MTISDFIQDAENSTNTTELDRKNTLGLIEITADFSTDNNLIGGKTYFICVKNADQWLHVGNSTLQSVKFAEQKRDTILPPALQVDICEFASDSIDPFV